MEQKPFSEFSPTPQSHFKLCFYGAVLNLIERVLRSLGSFEETFEKFPFLIGYNDELAEYGLGGVSVDKAAGWWDDSIDEWEGGAEGWLPLARLRQILLLDRRAIGALMCVGLVEEDSRFGTLFEVIQEQPGQRRSTLGLIKQWWGDESVQTLIDFGLLRVGSPELPRAERTLQVPGPIWEVLKGHIRGDIENWARVRIARDLPGLEELVLPDDLRTKVALIPALLRKGGARGLIVRGPNRNGRRTLVGTVARELGLGLLELNPAKADDESWKIAGALATLLGAMPLIVVDAGPGQNVLLPKLGAYNGPVAIVLGRQGGVSGEAAENAITLTLSMPGLAERRSLWRASITAAAGQSEDGEIELIGERYRMTGGSIRRAARLAVSNAALEGEESVTLAGVRTACRALNRQALDTLAVEITASGDWGELAVGSQTLAELFNLESRCRRRESLGSAVGAALSAQLNPGVRALFSGPSGTGKTLAAKLLASALEKDIYRVDLATVVNKYIGETEKNLNEVFSRAEELDVLLLLDEGDALLAGRTNVQSSNDRYANLETNYLLQRIEAYEGILIVTTNAADRIDSAFQRRMDVVVDFRPPGAAERHAIWQLHLPVRHSIDPDVLAEVAGRCALTGGQIRNAALHASLLAIEDGGIVTSSKIESAVQREYRKTGAVCPLRSASTVSFQRG
jgi:ATPase family protein associated with various cellular activities (AAA)